MASTEPLARQFLREHLDDIVRVLDASGDQEKKALYEQIVREYPSGAEIVYDSQDEIDSLIRQFASSEVDINVKTVLRIKYSIDEWYLHRDKVASDEDEDEDELLPEYADEEFFTTVTPQIEEILTKLPAEYEVSGPEPLLNGNGQGWFVEHASGATFNVTMELVE